MLRKRNIINNAKTYHSLYWSFHRAVQPEGTSGALGGGGPDGGAKSDIERDVVEVM